MPQHEPDSRPRHELKLGGKRVHLKLDGEELEPPRERGTATEAKPKPPTPDNPRPASPMRDVYGPYGA